jgi:hypothetical protein
MRLLLGCTRQKDKPVWKLRCWNGVWMIEANRHGRRHGAGCSRRHKRQRRNAARRSLAEVNRASLVTS